MTKLMQLDAEALYNNLQEAKNIACERSFR